MQRYVTSRQRKMHLNLCVSLIKANRQFNRFMAVFDAEKTHSLICLLKIHGIFWKWEQESLRNELIKTRNYLIQTLTLVSFSNCLIDAQCMFYKKKTTEQHYFKWSKINKKFNLYQSFSVSICEYSLLCATIIFLSFVIITRHFFFYCKTKYKIEV